jgi:membrane protein
MALKLKTFFRNFYDLLKEAGNDFLDDHGTKFSASLAYYTILSIGPILLVIITLMGFFYKKAYATSQLFEQIGQLLGDSESAQLKSILDSISKQNIGTLFGTIGILILLFSSTSIFTEIQSSINYIWSIRAKPKRSWLKYITDRLLSFVLIIGMGFLMLVTLFVNILIDLLSERLQRFLGHSDILLLNTANIALLFVVVTFLFAVIYKVLPDAKIHWKDALLGASFTGVLFLIGKFSIGYYLGNSKVISAYGAAASIILLLSWVYYSAIILYFGAECTKVYAMKWGKGITVNESAVYIIKREAKDLPKLKHPIQEN